MLIVTTADGSATVHSDKYGETYHSVNGAETESRHVFLEACNVRHRLEAGQPSRVLEIGFGLGLNCLLSTDAALLHNTALDYHAFENDLISATDFRRLQYDSLTHRRELIEWLAVDVLAANTMTPRARRVEFKTTETPHAQISVCLHLSDASCSAMPPGFFDAIYLDAFSPGTNPECWTIEFFAILRQKLSPDGILGTYSAKGSVRRALKAAGWDVNKMAGPPGKREILVATAAER